MAVAAGGRLGSYRPPPPIFSPDTSADHTDLPMPDFSYWGHEMSRLLGATPNPILNVTLNKPYP